MAGWGISTPYIKTALLKSTERYQSALVEHLSVF